MYMFGVPAIKCEQYDIETGKTIQSFSSLSKAAAAMNTETSNITKVIRSNGNKTCRGYGFRRVE